MAETFKIELVSPERLLMSEEVEQVIIPGSEGDFTVLYGHAPILSSIRPGILRILGGKSGDKEYFVRGGFAEARPDGLTILAQEARLIREFSADDINKDIKETEQVLEGEIDDETRRNFETALQCLKEIRGN